MNFFFVLVNFLATSIIEKLTALLAFTCTVALSPQMPHCLESLHIKILRQYTQLLESFGNLLRAYKRIVAL